MGVAVFIVCLQKSDWKNFSPVFSLSCYIDFIPHSDTLLGVTATGSQMKRAVTLNEIADFSEFEFKTFGITLQK